MIPGAAPAVDDVPGGATDVVDVEQPAASGAVRAQGQRTVRAWHFRSKGKPRSFRLTDLPRLAEDDSSFAWIDLDGFAREDVEEISRLLTLHPLIVRAVLDGWRRPHLHVFKRYFFVSVTVAHVGPEMHRVTAIELDLIVGRNVIVSAHRAPLPFADSLVERARHNPELLRVDSAYLLYIILDELLAHYESLIESVRDEIEAMEERALRARSESFLEEVLRLKRYVFALGRLADQHRGIFAAFTRPDFPYVSGDEVEPYFKDLEARLVRLTDNLYAMREAVNVAFDIYVSHVAHVTNSVIRVLTIVSVLLLPPTFVVGLFGTNFTESLPALFEAEGFAAMLVLLGGPSMILLLAFRRRGWL